MPDVLNDSQIAKIVELRSKCVIPLDKTADAVHKISYWTESGSVALELEPETASFLIASGTIVDRLIATIGEYVTLSKMGEDTMTRLEEVTTMLEESHAELKATKIELAAAKESLNAPGNASIAELSVAIAKNRVDFDREIESLRICFKSNTAHIKELQNQVVEMMDHESRLIALEMDNSIERSSPATNPLTSG